MTERSLIIHYTKQNCSGEWVECSRGEANYVTIEIASDADRRVIADFVYDFEKEAVAFAQMYANLCGIGLKDKR